MNDISDRINAIQARIGEIQSRFGHAAPPQQSFAKVLDQSAATGGASPTATAPAAGGGTQAWAPAIANAAARQHVDPALVRAVMSAESGGNPNAVSPVGAQG
ncbi:MAG TPA: transglycosylase SLT domain-containing protein, partial [Oscillatoriaceae cyanobacterium]